MRKYNAQNMMVGKRVVKLVVSISVDIIGLAMCINKTSLKCCLREIYELSYVSDDLRINHTGRSEESSESGTVSHDGERVVSL